MTWYQTVFPSGAAAAVYVLPKLQRQRHRFVLAKRKDREAVELYNSMAPTPPGSLGTGDNVGDG